MIHITDSQTDRILSYIALDEFWDDVHHKSLKDNFETYDFTTFADKKFSQYLTKRNRVIIPDEDGNYAEFIIENTRKYRSGSSLFMEVNSTASYLELKRSKVIYPETLTGQTAQTLVDLALDDTEWKAGTIHYKGIRTIKLENHTNPYNFLKAIASEFDLELNFRVVIDRNQVVARYVDLVERVGKWKGREVEFGTDLLGIERKEDTSNIVTALIGLGPTDSNGQRTEVFVEDLDALRRWGRNGKHIIETYEPEFSSDENATRERIETLTKNALKERINSVVEYTGDVNDLENLLGMQNKKIRFGDIIKIKDTNFDPPLYLEARVHTQERSLSGETRKKVTLGDYIEYTEDDVKAIWKKLQQEINNKLTKIVTVSVISSEGTVFKNGVGSTDLKALVYQGGKEIDESGMVYEYQWDVFDKNGNLVTSIFTKQITVYARDIIDVGTYVVTVGSNGVKMASSAITISNVFDGQPGPPGQDGKTLYTWIKYADDINGNGISDTPDGKKFIGIAYNKTEPTGSNNPADYKWALIQGPQGMQGPKGADGQTLYTWIKYADSPTSGMSDSPDGKKYIGLAYNKTTPTESSNYADYSWSLIQGPQGVQGPKGADGQTTYTWIKYADDDKGNGMSDSPNGKRYLGLAYNKTTPTESTNPNDYSWSPLYDNVQIGGRNLLPNTQDWNGWIPWNINAYKTSNTYEGCVIQEQNADWSYLRITSQKQLIAGKTYTASVWLKASVGGILKPYYSHESFPNNGTRILAMQSVDGDTKVTTEWKRWYVTFVANGTNHNVGARVEAQGFGTSGAILYAAGLKLEEGNRPTTWTPAPEDMQAEIDQAKQDAKNALMSADGKNTVFFQDTEPSKVGRKIGDLWFKTNEGNKIYRFDGSNWAPTPFGDAAIANLDVGKITANGIAANWLEAKHIKSLNGLNVGNGNFIIDNYGNVTFSGTLNGARGTFSGDLESATVVIGPKVASDIGAFDNFVGLELKMIERVSDNYYRFLEKNAVIKAVNSTVSFGPSNYFFMFHGTLSASQSLEVIGNLYTYSDIYASGYKLIDYGTNYNGKYIRFANGVQICWHTLSTQWFVDTPLGNVYYSGSNPWTFPASFYSTPEVFVNTKSVVGFSWAGIGAAAATTYLMSYCVFSPTRVMASAIVSLMAIGRWKA